MFWSRGVLYCYQTGWVGGGGGIYGPLCWEGNMRAPIENNWSWTSGLEGPIDRDICSLKWGKSKTQPILIIYIVLTSVCWKTGKYFSFTFLLHFKFTILKYEWTQTTKNSYTRHQGTFELKRKMETICNFMKTKYLQANNKILFTWMPVGRTKVLKYRTSWVY